MTSAALQFRACLLTGCAIVLGASIAVSFANDGGTPMRVGYFLNGFIMGSPNDIRDSAVPFAGTNFDIASFMTHPCYDIAGMEAKMCADSYGLTESLHSMLSRGIVTAYLRDRGIFSGTVTFEVAPTGPTAAAASSSSSSSGSEESVTTPVTTETTVTPLVPLARQQTEAERDLAQQTKSLWAICHQKFSGKEARLCFQRNHNLLFRHDVNVEGNVY